MTVRWQGDKVLREVRQAVLKGLVRGTELVREEAITSILSTQKTGRLYRRRSITHQASAAGETPASDTGRLVNSITTEINEVELAGVINAGTAYAAALEFGTAKMAERPYMRPALAKHRESIEVDIAKAIRSALAS